MSDQISDYGKEIEIMQNVTKEEYLASLRRYKYNVPLIIIINSSLIACML